MVSTKRGDELDDRLLRSFTDEVMRMTGRRTTTYTGSQLENSAFRILWMLEESGPRTLRELSDGLQLERSTLTRQVGAAVEQGYVEHVPGAGRSGRRIRPTSQGRRAYRHDAGLRRAKYAEALDQLGPDRAATMVESLRTFNDALDRAHERDAAD